MTTQQETLQQALEARIDEVAHYQLNIDNYETALKLLDERNDPDLADFKVQLSELLRTSIIEQKKAQVMLDAIKYHLGENV